MVHIFLCSRWNNKIYPHHFVHLENLRTIFGLGARCNMFLANSYNMKILITKTGIIGHHINIYIIPLTLFILMQIMPMTNKPQIMETFWYRKIYPSIYDWFTFLPGGKIAKNKQHPDMCMTTSCTAYHLFPLFNHYVSAHSSSSNWRICWPERHPRILYC